MPQDPGSISCIMATLSLFGNGHTPSINSSVTPQASQVLLLNGLWHGYLKHMPCNAIHIFTTPSSTLQLPDPAEAAYLK